MNSLVNFITDMAGSLQRFCFSWVVSKGVLRNPLISRYQITEGEGSVDLFLRSRYTPIPETDQWDLVTEKSQDQHTWTKLDLDFDYTAFASRVHAVLEEAILSKKETVYIEFSWLGKDFLLNLLAKKNGVITVSEYEDGHPKKHINSETLDGMGSVKEKWREKIPGILDTLKEVFWNTHNIELIVFRDHSGASITVVYTDNEEAKNEAVVNNRESYAQLLYYASKCLDKLNSGQMMNICDEMPKEGVTFHYHGQHAPSFVRRKVRDELEKKGGTLLQYERGLFVKKK